MIYCLIFKKFLVSIFICCQKFERVYHEQLYAEKVTREAQFNYAWCLVRSKYPADIRKGIIFLEELYRDDNGVGRRDYLYYLAIGNARIKVNKLNTNLLTLNISKQN